jgi:adenylate kinase
MQLATISTADLLSELHRRVNCAERKETRTIFVGPPGSGKGTQAPIIKEQFCLCHLSTGDMLRDAVKAGTEMGLKAKAVMDAGKLVSDDIVIGIVAEAIKDSSCKKGFILDGFPRTANQAKKLDEILAKDGHSIDKVVNLAVDDEILVKRVTGRLIHQASGRSYNIFFNPPEVAGKDDITGEPLIKRQDDTEDKLRTRLSEYHNQTTPVLTHYASKVVKINADDKISNITSQIVTGLSK